jgi:hypothetical protein
MEMIARTRNGKPPRRLKSTTAHRQTPGSPSRLRAPLGSAFLDLKVTKEVAIRINRRITGYSEKAVFRPPSDSTSVRVADPLGTGTGCTKVSGCTRRFPAVAACDARRLFYDKEAIVLRTKLCELLQIEAPILLAPMGPEIAGLELAAAVSNAGGLGMISFGGYRMTECFSLRGDISMLTL